MGEPVRWQQRIGRRALPLALAGALAALALAVPHRLAATPKRLTNPLLAQMKFRELKPFRDAVEAYCNGRKREGAAEEVAVYFRSLSDGIWFGINANDSFSPASLLKVPVMMAVFAAAERDPAVLKKELAYPLRPSPVPPLITQRESFVPGKKYTVEELTAHMIRNSDNSASDVLWDWLGERQVMHVFAELGMFREGVDPTGDFLSLRDFVRLLRVLYNASYLNEEYSEKALRLLAASAYRSGLVAGVPPDVTVALKFGERTFVDTGVRQLHEAGIVYYPSGTYLLGVMTRGRDYRQLADVIKGISAVVYREVDRQYKAPKGGRIATDD